LLLQVYELSTVRAPFLHPSLKHCLGAHAFLQAFFGEA
jgi:hypothetical protein